MIAPPVESQAVHAASRGEWRAWLDEHSETAAEAWLVIQHADSTTPGVRMAEAMTEPLCFGWVDSLARPRDAESCYLRFTPRRAASRWSQRNRDRVAELDRQGRMTDRGWAAVDRAKSLGLW